MNVLKKGLPDVLVNKVPDEGGRIVNGECVLVPEDGRLVSHQTGKRRANRYGISIPPRYKSKLLHGFRGIGAAEYFRQYTDELWTPPYCELTCAQYGAFRRILMMFTRSKNTLNSNFMIVTKKELDMHGISINLLQQIKTKTDVLDISLISDDGEINDLDWL